MFHINKQCAKDACKGDWILQLDADEVIAPKLRATILIVIKKKKYKCRVSDAAQKFLHWQMAFQKADSILIILCVCLKGKGMLPCKSVHEQIVIDAEVERLKSRFCITPTTRLRNIGAKADTYTTTYSSRFTKDV